MPKKHLEDDFSHIPNVAYVSPLELKPNRVLIGLGVATIIIALGMIGYLLVDKLFLGESATAVPNIEITKKSPTTKVATPSAQKAETADWKTFTSTKFGFKVKYPKEWKIAKETDSGANIFSQSELSAGLFIEVFIDENFNRSEYDKVRSFKVGEPTKVDANIPGTNLKDTYTRLGDTTIDGHKAVRYKFEPGFGDADNPKTYNVIVDKDDELYLIRNKLYDQGFGEGIKLLDQILSTFKSLD